MFYLFFKEDLLCSYSSYMANCSIPVSPIVFSEDVKKRVFLHIEKVIINISLNFILLCLAK